MATALARSQRRARSAVKAQGREARALSLAFSALELRLSAEAQQAILGDLLAQLGGRRRARARAHQLIARLRSDYLDRLRGVLALAYGEGGKLAGSRPQSRIAQAAISTLLNAASSRLDSALTEVGRQVDDIYRRVGLEQASRQIMAELPQGAATDLMRRDLMQRGITGFTDRAGRRWTLERYSEMVIRTTSAEAVAQGTVDAVLAGGGDLVRISDHDCKHHPTDPEHPCVALEGKTFSLTGASEGYPRLLRLPPFHPYCTHVVAPDTERAAQLREARRLEVVE